MIRVFGQTDKTFNGNGDVVIQPIKAKVHKEDNGAFYLNLETGLAYIDSLVEGNIVVVNTPQGDQAFRVGNVTKTKSKLVTKAYHVFYDSKNYLIPDCNVANKTCNEALYLLNGATEPQTEFSTSSDITSLNSFRCTRKSLYEAVQTVVERWGGHLIRDNFEIGVKASIGQDNGIVVQYKKNLKDITCSENWDNVVTKLLPVGKDGLLLNALDPTASIYIETTVQYALPYVKTVSFSQNDINEEDYATTEDYTQALIDDLYAQGASYLAQNCVPKVNYTLKANMEKLTDIGDVVEVIDDRLGVHLTTNVIAYDYDCLLDKYTEIVFGNFQNTLTGLVGNLTTQIDQTVTQQIQEATGSVNSQIAEKVTSPAKYAYDVGEYVVYSDILCEVIAPIEAGDLFQIGTNLRATTVGDEFETIWNKIYPVGAIYMSISDVSPEVLFGGTWEAIEDTFLLACGENYEAGTTGGEAEHTLTAEEIPAHSHGLEYSTDDGQTWSDAVIGKDGSVSGANQFGGSQNMTALTSYQARIKETGGGEPHNNMPPYLAVYMWQRTA